MCLVLFFADKYSAQRNQDTIRICSFNIQFLGHFKERDNLTLSKLMKPFDVVVVQEMVAPPVSGIFPSNGQKFEADLESRTFVEAMEKQGFNYWLSTEDTGPTKNHVNSSASEWWITFYRANKVLPDRSRFYGFIDSSLTFNPNFERVPYAMPFMSIDGSSTFTLVSLHLKPGDSPSDRKRRQVELGYLFNWIKNQDGDNLDYIALGDCNIYQDQEFIAFKKDSIFSLNQACLNTNTKVYEDKLKGKPYDHVFFTPSSSEEILLNSFQVVDIMELIKADFKQRGEVFPYLPYNHDLFRTKFSDHLPVSFDYILGNDTD